jgi:glycosyltransferase involved in cell wall biosynthesis
MWRALATAVLQSGLTIGQRCKWACYFVEAVVLARWLVAEGFHRLHCHFGNNGASTGMLAAQLAGIPFSMTCHGSELREIQRHHLVHKVQCASFVACVSEYGKAQLMSVCRRKDWGKLHIVRCGVSQLTAPSALWPADLPQILCVARLAPEKGHFVLLDALARLRDEGVNFRCTLIGDGPLRSEVESRLQELRLDSMITLAGSLDPEGVSNAYRTADVVVLASFSEGVPVVLMEAMAHGRPVVATRVGGVPELVQDGTNGLLVAPGNAGALANALKRILDNWEWAAELGANGTRHVRDEFGVETSVHRLVTLFGRPSLSRRETAAIGPKPQVCQASATPRDP